MNTSTSAIGALTCIVATFVAATVFAQTPAPATGKSVGASLGLLVYPSRGQTPDAQARDEKECYDWSKTQTGFDPASPPPAPAVAAAPADKEPAKPTGARAKGAVRGAASGALIGEVVDND